MLARVQSDWSVYPLLVDIEGTAILENSWTVSYLVSHMIQQSHCLPKRTRIVCSHQNLYVNIYSSFSS